MQSEAQKLISDLEEALLRMRNLDQALATQLLAKLDRLRMLVKA
jgi:hypothetical protein